MLSKCNFTTRDEFREILNPEQALITLNADFKLSALILCEIVETDSFKVVLSSPVPIEPLDGSEKHHVENVLRDCLKHPKIHIHAIGHLALPAIMKRFKQELGIGSKVWFFPIKVQTRQFIALSFPHHSSAEKQIPLAYQSRFFAALESYVSRSHAQELGETLAVMERYVKEVGHDIASSVQSTIAKLRNISEGNIPPEFIPRKAREAELEIMAAYRVAEGLGVTMEQNYQVREFKVFNLVEVVNDALSHHESEAQERNLGIEVRGIQSPLDVVGDSRAMEQAVGHLLSNAIKYSFGNTKIHLDLSEHEGHASVKVRNIGIPLPIGSAERKIWDFGTRSDEAKARHVNGTGIGLFTVRKIALAHHGMATCGHDVASKLTWFEISIPLASFIRKNRPDLWTHYVAR